MGWKRDHFLEGNGRTIKGANGLRCLLLHTDVPWRQTGTTALLFSHCSVCGAFLNHATYKAKIFLFFFYFFTEKSVLVKYEHVHNVCGVT